MWSDFYALSFVKNEKYKVVFCSKVNVRTEKLYFEVSLYNCELYAQYVELWLF